MREKRSLLYLLFVFLTLVIFVCHHIHSEKISLPVYRTHSVYDEDSEEFFFEEGVDYEESATKETFIKTLSKRQAKINAKGDEVRYITTIMAGNPPLDYSVMIDTGDSMTALPVAGCVCKGCGSGVCGRNEATGTPVACSSSICTTKRCGPVPSGAGKCGFSQVLANGGATIGYLLDTTVQIGSLSISTTVGGILIQTEPWNNTADGVLSLGFSSQQKSCLPNCVDNFMDTLVKKTNLPNIFTLSLTTGEGMLTIGGVDDQIKTNVSYVPLESDKFYGLKIASFAFGDQIVPVQSVAYIQSASSMNNVPKALLGAIKDAFTSKYSTLTGVSSKPSIFDGLCLSNLGIVKTYPSLSFNLDGLILKISPEDYFVPYPQNNKTGYCFGFSSDSGEQLVLGDPFLRALSVVFDRAQKKIGFATTSATNTKSTISTGPAYPSESGGGGLSGGEKAAIVICVLFAVALIIVVVVVVLRRQQQSTPNRMLY